MKKMILLFAAIALISICQVTGQDLKDKDVPSKVKAALSAKYPHATKVHWEKEKGNYEANWGGRSGEDNSVLFTPAAEFVEMVVAIPVSQLPAAVHTYVTRHYKGAKITEADKVTDASGKHMYEAEIKGKDLVFDESGTFIKKD